VLAAQQRSAREQFDARHGEQTDEENQSSGTGQQRKPRTSR
jgi:hypothetical protein